MVGTQSLMVILLSLSLCGGSETAAETKSAKQLFSSLEKPSVAEIKKGYRAVTPYGDQYIAVGTCGRIDCISQSKMITPLQCPVKADLNYVISGSGRIIAVGDKGTILISSDGLSFKKIISETDKDINGITEFKGLLIAVADDGVILVSSDGGDHWQQTQLGLKGNIRSISASGVICMGVTDQGEIIKTTDGRNWELFDFNREYSGYYRACAFNAVQFYGSIFLVVGRNQDGSPAIYFSELGDIWTPRELVYTDGSGTYQAVKNIPNAIGAAIDQDQMFLACDQGEVVTLPACFKCNKSALISRENLKGIVCSNSFLIVVGDDYYVNIFPINEVRQDKIAAQQALQDFKNGAYIVDVRTVEEYKGLHVKGCLNIPVDVVTDRLPKEIPDLNAEIIFYCAKGVRAQKALEQALAMGYQRVYNLGGIDDWIYGKEAGGKSE